MSAMYRRRWVLAADKDDAIQAAWEAVTSQSERDTAPLSSLGVVLSAPEDMWTLWAAWGRDEHGQAQRERWPHGYMVLWTWERPVCRPEEKHVHHVVPSDGRCPRVTRSLTVTDEPLWWTPTGYPPERDESCLAALESGVRCAICFYRPQVGPEGVGLCTAHACEDLAAWKLRRR